MPESVEYEIDGRRTRTLEDFFAVVGEAVTGSNGYFGRNLDSFSDCLIGGYGTPEDGNFRFVWRSSATSRASLGYAETIRQLRTMIRNCHPDNRAAMRNDLERAMRGEGPTVFDWIVRIFQARGVALILA